MVPCLMIKNEGPIAPCKDRRVSDRVQCEAAITCTHFDLQCHPKACNLSEAGLCFHAEFAMEKGLFIHVRIDEMSIVDRLQNQDEFSWPTAAGAQVRWCRKIRAADEYEMGVKFLISPRKKSRFGV